MRVTDEMVGAARDAARRVAGDVFTPSGLLLREAIEAALAAAPQAEQEPVAWRWKAVIDGDRIWNWVLTHSDPPPYAVARQPLYTAPQPAPNDKLREAARMALTALDAADDESVTRREFEARALAARDELSNALGEQK